MSRMSELVYPDTPGFKAPGPSQDAAKAISGTAARMRAMVLQKIAQRPATADEIAHELGLSVLSVRPRVSELKRAGEIRQTTMRRKNDSGMTATVWQLAPPLPGGSR
jgi:predicted ArsR family transcriptional regulator